MKTETIVTTLALLLVAALCFSRPDLHRTAQRAQNESGLQQRIKELEAKLQQKSELTILDSQHWNTFVTYNSDGYDPLSDFTYVAKEIVPESAKGLVVKVLLRGKAASEPNSNSYTSVIATDTTGEFAHRVHYTQIGYSNYNDNWVGGKIFVPFINGERKIKLRVTSNAMTQTPPEPDPTVLLIATCIGYF